MEGPRPAGARVGDRAILLAMLDPRPARDDARDLCMAPRVLLRRRLDLLRRLDATLLPRLGGQVLLIRMVRFVDSGRRTAHPVPVFVACTAAGDLRVVLDPIPLGLEATSVLAAHFGVGTILVCSAPPRGAFARAVARAGLTCIPRARVGLHHPLEAHEAAARGRGRALFAWLRRFRGVGPATLPLYVAWHEALMVARVQADPVSAWLAFWPPPAPDAATPRSRLTVP